MEVLRFDGEADAMQKNIVVNHVAIGPKGWGRAGPDCAIRTDSTLTKGQNVETIHLDDIDIALSKESITTLLVQTINQGLKPDIAESTKRQKEPSLERQRKRLSGVGFKPLIETGRLGWC